MESTTPRRAATSDNVSLINAGAGQGLANDGLANDGLASGYNGMMFSIRGLFAITLFVACLTALGQLGTISGVEPGYLVRVLFAVGMQLMAFLSILIWIHEVEQLRSDDRKLAVIFADVTAFLMFVGQLYMAGRVFGINLLNG